MFDPTHLRKILPPDVWFGKIDISDAFLHVPISDRFKKFLAFSHEGVLYQFNATPFGLNISPRVFTRFSKVPLKLAHLQNIQTSVYLDDWLVWHHDYTECQRSLHKLRTILADLGFAVNDTKSQLIPSRSITYLGVWWDGERNLVSPSSQNLLSTSRLLDSLLATTKLSQHKCQVLQGKLNFLSALIPQGRRHFLETLLALPLKLRRNKQSPPLPLSSEAKTYLRQWLHRTKNPVPIPLRAPPPSLSIWTDASDDGWGATSSLLTTTAAPWPPHQRSLHITAKETLAVLLALQAFQPPQHTTVRLFTDCSSTVALLKNQGSLRSPTLQEIYKNIEKFLLNHHLSIRAAHVPGEHNSWADSLSRRFPTGNDWVLPRKTFRRLCSQGPSPRIDLFAHPTNNRLSNFYAPLPYPLAAGADALSQDWDQWETIYMFPPYALITPALQKLHSYQGRGIAILPFTPSQVWWELIPQRATMLPDPLPVCQRTLTGLKWKRPHSETSFNYHAWIF